MDGKRMGDGNVKWFRGYNVRRRGRNGVERRSSGEDSRETAMHEVRSILLVSGLNSNCTIRVEGLTGEDYRDVDLLKSYYRHTNAHIHANAAFARRPDRSRNYRCLDNFRAIQNGKRSDMFFHFLFLSARCFSCFAISSFLMRVSNFH